MKNTSDWMLMDSYFSWEELYDRLEMVSREGHLEQTQKALVYMKKCHENQYRNKAWYTDAKVPYIIHPLTMAWQAYLLGFVKDYLLATLLLHDVCEDCGKAPGELPFSEEVRDLACLLTFVNPPDMSRDEAKRRYFERIGQNTDASVIKVIDRCNNISTMASTFTKDRMTIYINETEQYIYPLLQNLKTKGKEYGGQIFLLEYHMLSVLESIKSLILRPSLS